MKNLQDIIDRAHIAAGGSKQRTFEHSESFKDPNDGPDEMVTEHEHAVDKTAEDARVRTETATCLRMILSAADGVASVKS